jgi:hypothetical protein
MKEPTKRFSETECARKASKQSVARTDSERLTMSETGSERGRPWSIVLAGGRAERLATFTERWLGRYVPKHPYEIGGRTDTVVRSFLEKPSVEDVRSARTYT